MTRDCQLCIVGGGPAGLFAGLLFARAGVETLVIEKHNDFLRDFRGDTVHPSTLELFDQLGLLESLLALPHDRVETIGGRIMGEMLTIADFRHLKVPAPYIALMPQWDLLAFIAAEASHYPNFTLRMNCEATGVTTAPTGRVTGVKIARGKDISADLVIAADGRGSVIRTAAALPLETIGAPMDVFWFRVAKHPADANATFGVFENGRIGVFIDRGDYWQVAFVFAKGGAQALRSRGLDSFKATVTDMAPGLAHGIAALAHWDEVKLLRVSLDRLTRWHRHGLLVIGDAAHAMSPIGGVGINLAIQDAVAAANVLAGPMAAGASFDALLQEVQGRRWKPTVRMQALQKAAQDRLISPLLSGTSTRQRPPWQLRLLQYLPILQRIPARIMGLGFGRERIESPDAGQRRA
ncbi:FAD-dependent oxidoreductase [Sphingorhabdus soli]|uniref:FAD-dependent oxidoreductase n=1 Tax=Flavisphingopyxis soli TaxID=2601267 RepID=A0A5C6U713_9SPHN|nr:FAD-dependent oxidoreductase [Sphingorhabdus soli]TXC68803.1 FAD-dependent oxidoreductase [Sphingorhabdus soli]